MNRIGDKGAVRVQHSPGTSLNHCQQYSASSHGSCSGSDWKWQTMGQTFHTPKPPVKGCSEGCDEMPSVSPQNTW